MGVSALQLQNAAYMAAPWNVAYNFGTGNFTVEAWIKPAGAGTIISRKPTEGNPGNGGFLLVLKPDGSFKLATDSGVGFFEVDSQATSVFDHAWHYIAATRAGTNISLYLDGHQLPATPSGNASPPLDVNNSLRMVIGATDQNQEPYNHYTGLIGEVRVWSVARSQADLSSHMYTELTGNEAGLVGYWKLDGNGNDASSTRNNAAPVGSVSYVTPGPPLQGAIWPTTLNNPSNQGRSPFIGPNAFTQLWATSVGGAMRGGPVVDAQGNIYVGCEDKKLYSITANGAIKWTYTSDYPFYPTPAIGSDGTIYGASDMVQALTPAGALKWKYERRDIAMVITVPLKLNTAGDTIYLVANSSTGQGDRIIALNTANGTAKWEMKFSKGSSSTPGIGPDGTVYVGSEEATVYALDPLTGAVKWQHQEAGSLGIRGPIAIDDSGNIYFCRSTQSPAANAVVCLNPNGSIKWTYSTGEYLANPPSIAIGVDGTIYAGFYGMHAIAPNGQKKWSSKTTGNVGIYPGAAVVDASGNVYFGTSDGKILAYSANGIALWQGDHGANSCGPVLAATGLLYFSGNQGSVFAVKSVAPPITQAPTIQLVSYDGSQLSSQWTAVNESGVTGYTLAIFQNDTLLHSVNTTALQGTFQVSLSPASSYTVKVQATGVDGPGPWSTPVSVIVAVPAISQIVYNGQQVAASWSAVSEAGVSGYTLQIVTGNTLVAHTTTTGTSSNLAATLDPATAYQVRVQATGTATTGPWSTPVSVIVTAPTHGELFYNGTALVYSWDAVSSPGVTQYNAQLFKNDQLAENLDTAGLTVTFAEALRAGATYKAQVRATGAQTAGPWSSFAAGPLSSSVTYNYDELGRLHQMVINSRTTITYTYDDRGNIISETYA